MQCSCLKTLTLSGKLVLILTRVDLTLLLNECYMLVKMVIRMLFVARNAVKPKRLH
jgi:hypothetical protein